MNQSAVLGGALLAGFALFIASRNRLTTYGRVLWGAKPESHAGGETETPAPGSTANSVPNTIAGATLGQWAQDFGSKMDDFGHSMDNFGKQFDDLFGAGQ